MLACHKTTKRPPPTIFQANELRRLLYEMHVDGGPYQDKAKFRDEVLPKWLTHLNK